MAKCRFARMDKCRLRGTADYNAHPNIKNTDYISQIYFTNPLNKIINTLHNIYSHYIPYLLLKYKFNQNWNTVGYHGNSRYCCVPNNSGGVIRVQYSVGEGKNGNTGFIKSIFDFQKSSESKKDCIFGSSRENRAKTHFGTLPPSGRLLRHFATFKSALISALSHIFLGCFLACALF